MVRTYREMRTPVVLAPVVFGHVHLAENGVAIHVILGRKMISAADSTVQSAVAVLRVLQFVAPAFPAWATLQ